MTILDANILLYAYNQAAPQHDAAREWLDSLFSKPETIGLPWTTIWAFLRIITNPRLFPQPVDATQAFRIIRSWLSVPGVIIVEPGVRHAELLEQLVTKGRAIGPLVSDAVLAALAIEQGAILASTDRDFSRFQGLRWINPLP